MNSRQSPGKRSSGQIGRRVYIGLDYFDASINRVAAWVIGMRNLMKALLIGLLEPGHLLRDAEQKMDFTPRLATFEELKSLPWGPVWDYYCLKKGVPAGLDWHEKIRQYESRVLAVRDGRTPAMTASR